MKELFVNTQAERVALARQRYFEEGQLPTGVVSDAVFQSWARCQRNAHDPRAKVEFQPVTASRAQLALQKNRLLHSAWQNEAAELDAVLGSTNCSALLTDPTGVLIGATCSARANESITPVAHRVGVNFSEELVGTTAPGIVVRTGQIACVRGAEHFFESVNAMHCAAAPIRDIHGKIAGVLDISSEGMPFNFDAATVVGFYASSIENRLLIAQSAEHLIVRFQIAPSMLETPMAGLMGVDLDGHIVWRNAAASKLLGLSAERDRQGPFTVDEVLQISFSELASIRAGHTSVMRLPNGLLVHVRCDMRAQDGRHDLTPVGGAAFVEAAVNEPVEAPTHAVAQEPVTVLEPDFASPASLRDADVDLIAKTLKECGGNVSATARKLRVSRGLIYRRMQATGN